MNFMRKVNRALKNSKVKVSTMQFDSGTQKIAETDFVVFNEGKAVPLTLKVVADLPTKDQDPKVEIIVWDTRFKVVGKVVPLENLHLQIPGFEKTNELFVSELAEITKRVTEKELLPQEMVAANYQQRGKSNYSLIYPDK